MKPVVRAAVLGLVRFGVVGAQRLADTSTTSSASETRSTGRTARCSRASRSASIWSVPDPAIITGSHEERLARVIEVREALRARIEAWLATLSSTDSTPRTTTRN